MAGNEQSAERKLFPDWDSVRIAVDEITANEAEHFDPRTIANAGDLLEVCSSQIEPPLSIEKGYWATVSLSWEHSELEVFEDRIEVYRFEDHNTEIWYEEHRPGGPFTARFLSELMTLAL